MDAAAFTANLLSRLEDICHGAADEQADVWSRFCQKFLDAHRTFLQVEEPSKELIQAHRTALKWMLRMAKTIYVTASDPDYPDKRIANEIHGRLIQLEHTWEMTHGNKLTQAEAEKLTAEVFPG